MIQAYTYLCPFNCFIFPKQSWEIQFYENGARNYLSGILNHIYKISFQRERVMVKLIKIYIFIYTYMHTYISTIKRSSLDIIKISYLYQFKFLDLKGLSLESSVYNITPCKLITKQNQKNNSDSVR